MKIKKKSKLLLLSGIAFVAPLTMVAAACSSQTFDTGPAQETTAADIDGLDPELEKPTVVKKEKTFDLANIENKISGTIQAVSDTKGHLKLAFSDLGDYSGKSVTIYFTPTTGNSKRITKNDVSLESSLSFSDLEPSTTYQVVIESDDSAIFGQNATTTNSTLPVYISYFSDYSTKHSVSFSSIIANSQLSKSDRGQVKIKYTLATTPSEGENTPIERSFDIQSSETRPIFTVDGLKENTTYNYTVYLVEGQKEQQLATGNFATILPTFALDTKDLPLADGVSANTPHEKALLLKTNLKGYLLLKKEVEVLYKKATDTEWKKAKLEDSGDLDVQKLLDADTSAPTDSPFAYYDFKIQIEPETTTTTADTEGGGTSGAGSNPTVPGGTSGNSASSNTQASDSAQSNPSSDSNTPQPSGSSGAAGQGNSGSGDASQSGAGGSQAGSQANGEQSGIVERNGGDTRISNNAQSTPTEPQETAPQKDILLDQQLMLVNPKKINTLVVDIENEKMKAVNANSNATYPNITMFLFKHLPDKQEITNLLYSLNSQYYSSDFANLVLTKMVEQIKNFFVTYTTNTTYLNWNKPNEGVYALVLDPNYVKTDGERFDNFVSLLVGGFNPTVARTITFKDQQIRQTEIMEDNWKLKSYNYQAKNYPQNISVPTFVKAIKFMIGWRKDSYTYVAKTSASSAPITNTNTDDPQS